MGQDRMISVRVNTSEYDRQMAKILRIPMLPINREIGKVGVELIQSTFIRQRSFNGHFWRNLSPVTLHLRRRKGSSSTLKLIDTGRLFASTKASVSARGVEWTNDAPGAADQNFGNPENRIFGKSAAPIPARPFMPDSTNIPNTWVKRLTAPLDEALRKVVQ